MADADPNAHVAQILSSYLSNNTVPAAELSAVIESVKRAFGATVAEGAMPAAADNLKTWEPAVLVKKSIMPDALTCLCCGHSFKSLKRHCKRRTNSTQASTTPPSTSKLIIPSSPRITP